MLRTGVVDVLIVDEPNARILAESAPDPNTASLERRSAVPVVPTREILQRAYAERYGVAAINVVNDLTMHAVLEAAEELRAPVIVQTSVKHVELTGAEVMIAMWRR